MVNFIQNFFCTIKCKYISLNVGMELPVLCDKEMDMYFLAQR